MRSRRRSLSVGVACLLLASVVAAGPQDKPAKDKDSGDKEKRPKLSLTARPPIAMSPARVSLTAELAGGPDDLEEFYCPTIEWDWGDGTSSETSSDCDERTAPNYSPNARPAGARIDLLCFHGCPGCPAQQLSPTNQTGSYSAECAFTTE